EDEPDQRDHEEHGPLAPGQPRADQLAIGDPCGQRAQPEPTVPGGAACFQTGAYGRYEWYSVATAASPSCCAASSSGTMSATVEGASFVLSGQSTSSRLPAGSRR